MLRLPSLFLIFFFFSSLPALAAPTLLEAWQQETNELLDGIDERERKQFEILTLSNGILHSIQHVEKTLGNAVKSCGEAQPHLKDDLYAYYGGLQKNLTGPMKSAKSRISKMIKSQTITTPKRMRAYINLTNKVAVEKDNEVKWIPISREDDCEDLLDKLKDEETTQKLVSHLNNKFGVGEELK